LEGRSMGRALTRRDFLRAGSGAFAGVYVLGLAGCGQSGGGGSGWAPTQNVVMIVPFEAGGGSDILGRAMASGMEGVRKDINITVENRPSGSGAVGYAYLLEQQGDPHFLLASETTAVALPITTETPWTWEDFTPIAQIAEDATLMVVPQDSDFESLQDVLDVAEQQRLTVGVAGATGLDTIVFGLVERQEGVEFERVVFESGGEIVNAQLGGDIDLASLNPGEVIGQIESGDLKPLVAFAEERYEEEPLSSVPLAKEEGVDVSFTQFRGALAPGGIAPEEREYWADALVAWTETQDYKKYIADNYLMSKIRTGQEFESYLREQEQTLQEGIFDNQGG
jgi:putative tricarboxylic transport membrane protein